MTWLSRATPASQKLEKTERNVKRGLMETFYFSVFQTVFCFVSSSSSASKLSLHYVTSHLMIEQRNSFHKNCINQTFIFSCFVVGSVILVQFSSCLSMINDHVHAEVATHSSQTKNGWSLSVDDDDVSI